MRKIGLILIILLSIKPTFTAFQGDELIKIARIVTDHNQSVDEWTVTIKEKMNAQTAIEIVNTLKKNHTVTQKTNTKTTDYLITTQHNRHKVDTSYHIIIPNETSQPASVVALINGLSWDKTIEKTYYKEVQKITKLPFTNKSYVYTCLITNNDDIIKSSDFIGKIIKKLDLSNISTQIDTIEQSTHKKVIYGYTTIWANKEIVIETPLNVQIVMESNEKGQARAIIGTPILINEY